MMTSVNMDYYYTPSGQDNNDIQVSHYVIADQPGYYYNWIAPLQQWGLKWKPIKNSYCPPVWDNSIQWIHLDIPEYINIIPLLGDGEMHLQKLAEEMGATYIYYRQDLKKIEIWAQDISGCVAIMAIYFNKFKKQQKTKQNMILQPKLK